MLTYSFPDDPGRRRALIVLKDFEYDKCRYSSGGSDLLTNEELHVVPTSVFGRGDLPVSLQNIYRRHVARPGAVLVQSPFNSDNYESLETASEKFAKEKYAIIDRFCQKLGAKSLQIDEVEAQTERRSATFDGKAGNKAFKLTGRTELEMAKSLHSELKSMSKWVGGPPDLPGAATVLNENGLRFDSTLNSLIDMRKDDNSLLHKQITIKLSNETQSNLRVVAKLNIPQYVSLAVDCKLEIRKTASYSVTIDVHF
jgi:hypothetical protein